MDLLLPQAVRRSFHPKTRRGEGRKQTQGVEYSRLLVSSNFTLIGQFRQEEIKH